MDLHVRTRAITKGSVLWGLPLLHWKAVISFWNLIYRGCRHSKCSQKQMKWLSRWEKMTSEKWLKDCSLAQWWLKRTSAYKYSMGGNIWKRGFFFFQLKVERNCMKGQAKGTIWFLNLLFPLGHWWLIMTFCLNFLISKKWGMSKWKPGSVKVERHQNSTEDSPSSL